MISCRTGNYRMHSDCGFDEIPYRKRLLILFLSFARIVIFVVGGGYAILPVMEEVFVRKYKWIKHEEMLDIVALTQTIPGIIACNAAIYIGMRVAGVGGAIAAVLGVITPSITVLSIMAAFFSAVPVDNRWIAGAFFGVRACIAGLIIVTAVKLAGKTFKTHFDFVIAGLILFALLFLKWNPAYLILASMPPGIIYCILMKRRIEAAAAKPGDDVK